MATVVADLCLKGVCSRSILLHCSALESIILGGAKKILGCLSRTCNEAVRGDMDLEGIVG